METSSTKTNAPAQVGEPGISLVFHLMAFLSRLAQTDNLLANLPENKYSKDFQGSWEQIRKKYYDLVELLSDSPSPEEAKEKLKSSEQNLSAVHYQIMWALVFLKQQIPRMLIDLESLSQVGINTSIYEWYLSILLGRYLELIKLAATGKGVQQEKNVSLSDEIEQQAAWLARTSGCARSIMATGIMLRQMRGEWEWWRFAVPSTSARSTEQNPGNPFRLSGEVARVCCRRTRPFECSSGGRPT